MIAQSPPNESYATQQLALVRYGAIPEIARAEVPDDLALQRDDQVVIQTHRGEELGQVLQVLPRREAELNFSVQRLATAEETALVDQLRREAQGQFLVWQVRIRDWQLDLQLLDVEWTLDRSKLILYVLSGRNADTTKLALQAATVSSTVIEIQPVSAEGLVPMPPASGGGCGCGSGGGGCHT